MSPDELAAWVTESCQRHGVPVKVTDALVVRDVVTLLGRPAERPRGGGADPGPTPAGSELPHQIDTGRIKTSSTRIARPDDSVIQHRTDDRGLARQAERRPLAG